MHKGGRRSVCSCVRGKCGEVKGCGDRCFEVREFVFSRGGVSKFPAD